MLVVGVLCVVCSGVCEWAYGFSVVWPVFSITQVVTRSYHTNQTTIVFCIGVPVCMSNVCGVDVFCVGVVV